MLDRSIAMKIEISKRNNKSPENGLYLLPALETEDNHGLIVCIVCMKSLH